MTFSLRCALVLAITSLASAADHQSTGTKDENMGPAAFMWPPDRVWSGDMDNQAPCGSRAAAGNRTKFPLTAGALALVAQDDYYNTKISISYKSDPTTNTDFSTIIEEQSVADLDPGHTCVKVPDAPSSITAGTNATLQIIYRADWDAPHNQTFYACADITYVLAADFTTRIPCFNATEPGEDNIRATSSPTSTPQPATGGGSSGGSSGLSGGAIAGVVIGAIAGVALIAGAALFLYRRKQRQQRNERLARMEDNARRDQWAPGKSSSSQNSVPLSNMN